MSAAYKGGDVLFITNLKYHRHLFSTNFLSLTKNSFCKKVNATSGTSFSFSKELKRSPRYKSKEEEDQANDVFSISQVEEEALSDYQIYEQSPKKNELLHQGRLITFFSLHSLISTFPSYEDIQTLVGSELSVAVILLDWSLDVSSSTNSQSKGNTGLEVNCLRLFACDANQYGVEITIPVLTQYAKQLTYLQKNRMIFIELGAIIEVDQLHEVIRLQRADHTKIFPITPETLDLSSYSIEQSISSPKVGILVEEKLEMKINNDQQNKPSESIFVTPKNTRKRKASDANLAHSTNNSSSIEKKSILTTSGRKRPLPVTPSTLSTEKRRKVLKLEKIVEEYSVLVESFQKRGHMTAWEEERQRYISLRCNHTHYLSPFFHHLPLLSCSRRSICGQLKIVGRVQLSSSGNLDGNTFFQQPLSATFNQPMKEGTDDWKVKEDEKESILCRVFPYRRIEEAQGNRRVLSWQCQPDLTFLCLLPLQLFEEYREILLDSSKNLLLRILLHSVLISFSFTRDNVRQLDQLHEESDGMIASQAIVNLLPLENEKVN